MGQYRKALAATESDPALAALAVRVYAADPVGRWRPGPRACLPVVGSSQVH
jgi:hypothetical protein